MMHPFVELAQEVFNKLSPLEQAHLKIRVLEYELEEARTLIEVLQDSAKQEEEMKNKNIS